MWSRLFAVFSLFLLSPLVAEYLLGSLPMAMIFILPVMALMYGAGAVVIRELVRQSGRGWPSIILLATAYGVIEEGLVTQSLFNPNYLHLRLLDYGWIPALGTGLPWLIYVLALHMFWSISVPIGLTESLFVGKRDTPWLGKIGVGIFAALFIAGTAMVAAFTYKSLPFMASPAQLGASAAAALALGVAAFVWPKRKAATGRPAPHPLVLFLVALVIGSAFVVTETLGARILHLLWPAAAAVLVGCEALMLVFMVALTRHRVWTHVQRFALMAGGLGVYIWFGFPTDVDLHKAGDLPAHAVLAVIFVALTALAGYRAFKSKSQIAVERQAGEV